MLGSSVAQTTKLAGPFPSIKSDEAIDCRRFIFLFPANQAAHQPVGGEQIGRVTSSWVVEASGWPESITKVQSRLGGLIRLHELIWLD